ncbi:Arabinogalactan peptide, AGP [Corchorus olitorius]|uniref:Arabinogalactan peptide, AGP n=1 Tax=Corchorus olitorius TaxID=93759 RepID=A0A1R3GE98_9ROSI|nr:Arabinogalactan peptide, AGP [Corchorus olitorius]
MGQAQSTSPAPAPTSDGTAIDQGIAYILMLVALAITYLIH